MDEPKSPEDILDEIMNRTLDSSPSPTSFPPEFDPLPPEDPPLPPLKVPEGAAKPDWAARLLPWLCLMLGAALLVMGMCVLQVAKVNDRLDALQQTVEAIQDASQDNKQLRRDIEDAQEEAGRIKEENEQLEAIIDNVLIERNNQATQARLLNYLFYIGQFISNGDEPMAALVVGLSADEYFSSLLHDSYPFRESDNFLTYMDQYQAYRKKLMEQGYLQDSNSTETGFPSVTFAPQWNPEENSDMAALGLLWCVMDQYYVRDDPHTAVQFLVGYQNYPLRGTGTGCLAHLSSIAGNDASWQYELLLSSLRENGYLVETDGQFDYGTFHGSWTDVLYALPFEPPIDLSAVRFYGTATDID